MKKLFGALLAVAALSGIASAQGFFLGLSGVGISVPTGSGAYVGGSLYGIQAGSYNLFGPVGLRGNIESGTQALAGAYQAALDLVYTSGGGSKLVLGGGVGVVSIPGASITNPYIELLVGGDFVIASSPVSFFIEAQGRFYPSTGGNLFPAHLGFNFHF